MKTDSEHCGICGVALVEDESSMQHNCGGDCMRCMAEEGDPTALELMYPIQKARISTLEAELLAARDLLAGEQAENSELRALVDRLRENPNCADAFSQIGQDQ